MSRPVQPTGPWSGTGNALGPAKGAQNAQPGVAPSTTGAILPPEDLTPVEQTGSFSLDAVLLKTQASSGTLDAIILKTQSSSATLDAVIKKTLSGSGTLDAVVLKTQAASLTLDAVLLKTQASSWTLDAVLLKTMSATAALDSVLLATLTGSFSLDAMVAVVQSASATLDAIVLRTQSGSHTLDAVVLKTQTGSGTLDAVLLDEQAGSLTLDAVFLKAQSGSGTLDAVLAKTQAGALTLDAVLAKTMANAFGLDAEISTAVTVTTVGAYSLDAYIIGGPGQHSRADDHFATQPDTVITVVGLSGYPDGMLLSEVLASLFARAADLGDHPSFGLDAVIAAPAVTPQSGSFGLDARIARGGSFGLSAIVKHTFHVETFGLDAVIAGTQSWNLIRTPMSGGEVAYTAIVAGLVTPPSYAANGIVFNDFGGDAWRKNAAGAIGDWWQATWNVAQTIDRVVIYCGSRQSGGGTFTNARFGNTGNVLFSDGSSVAWSGLNDTFVTLNFAARSVSWLRLVTATAGGSTAQLTEVEAFNTQQWED